MNTGVLCPHTPDYFNVTYVDANWRPDAQFKGSHLQRFLATSLVDEGQIGLLQEWTGYLLSGSTRQQKAAMITGATRSGKGTYARLLKGLLPSQISTIVSSQLGGRFTLESTIGKMVLLVPDVRLSKDSDFEAITEMLLTVTGEDHVDIERKGRTSWVGKTTVRPMIASNSIPMFRDSGGVLANRFIYIHFSGNHLGREDPDLDINLAAERDIALLWAVLGWQRLQANKHFAITDQHKQMMKDTAIRMDPVGTFFSSQVEITGQADDVVIFANLFIAFEYFCHNNEITGFTRDGFAKIVKNKLGLTSTQMHKGTVRAYRGLKVRFLLPGMF